MLLDTLEGTRPGIIARILLVAGAIFCCHTPTARAEGEGGAFTFSTVREVARALAAKDFRPQQNSDLPDALKKLTYDEYQMIRFLPEHNLWKDDHVRFMAQFFQRGYLYQDPVRIHVMDRGSVTDVAFSPEQFDYDTIRVPKNLPAPIQFAGFRLLYPLNSPQKMDEVAEFLGASYFRVLGASQRYGASIRGLAIDTAETTGEEFPDLQNSGLKSLLHWPAAFECSLSHE